MTVWARFHDKYSFIDRRSTRLNRTGIRKYSLRGTTNINWKDYKGNWWTTW